MVFAAGAARRSLAVFCKFFALLVTVGHSAVVCQTEPIASAGAQYRWPEPNPALVSPLTAFFRYEPYQQPLTATFTGSDITISIPPDFVAGFNLTDSSGSTMESYRMTSIQVRKPGLTTSGGNEAVAHVFELALLHQEITGTGYWASVIVPIEVTADPTADILTPLFVGTSPPAEVGQRLTLLISTAVAFDLAAVWADSSFSSYWVRLPTDCSGFEASSRQLMRSSALSTLQSTFSYLLGSFTRSVQLPAVTPPEVTWIVGTCPSGGNCIEMTEAEKLTSMQDKALQTQSTSIARLRASKDLMDEALQLLRNSTPGAYEIALSARDTLHAADSELTNAKKDIEKVTQWAAVAAGAVWDSDAPPPDSTHAILAGQTTRDSTTEAPVQTTSGTTSPDQPTTSATSASSGASLLDILHQAERSRAAGAIDGHLAAGKPLRYVQGVKRRISVF